jgi:hypothetical protein
MHDACGLQKQIKRMTVTFSWSRTNELKLRLPAAFGNMVESHEHQIGQVDPVGTRTNGPDWVTVLFHWTSIVFLKGAVRPCSN